MNTENGRRENNAHQSASASGWRFWAGFLIACGFWYPLLVATPIVLLAFFGSLASYHIIYASLFFVGFVWWIHFRYRKSLANGGDQKLARYVGFRRGVEAVSIGIKGEYLRGEGGK